jgi:hypothetical protein
LPRLERPDEFDGEGGFTAVPAGTADDDELRKV